MGGDGATALRTIDDALVALPGEENLRFVRAGALFASGDNEAGIAEVRSLIASRPTWEVVVRSFAAKGTHHRSRGHVDRRHSRLTAPRRDPTRILRRSQYRSRRGSWLRRRAAGAALLGFRGTGSGDIRSRSTRPARAGSAQ